MFKLVNTELFILKGTQHSYLTKEIRARIKHPIVLKEI